MGETRGMFVEGKLRSKGQTIEGQKHLEEKIAMGH